MDRIVRHFREAGVFGYLYVTSLLFGFHSFLVSYINSSFLARFVGEEAMGIVFMMTAVLAVIGFASVSLLLRAVGNYRLILALLLVEFAAFLGLALTEEPAYLLMLFAVYQLVLPLLFFNLDIFVETYSRSESSTGNMRGTMLTMTNIALVLSPIIAGFVVGEGNEYSRVYLAAAFFLVPAFLLVATKFKTFSDPHYLLFSFRRTFARVVGDANLGGIFFSQFLMRFFFSWMVIYMPIYLHIHIGFTWPEIGLMLTIILLPYLFIELPAGRLADKRFGEKEFLLAGIGITALSTALLALPLGANFILWTVLLFITRVGTSFIEISTESYFFKHVDGDDADAISAFRMLRPLAYVFGPLLATGTLLLLTPSLLWLVLAVVLLIGIPPILALKDTR